MVGLLGDIRVLDLSSNICGPYCTKLFADFGAEVIKIESPEGDPMRKRTASGRDLQGESGAFFKFLNTSKQSLVLDLSQDRERFLELVAAADLLVEDLGQKKLESLGFSVNELMSHNPDLTLLSVSEWGWGGPFDEFPANEFTLQSWVGSISHRGIPKHMPYGVGGSLGEFMSAASAAASALGAVLAAKSEGGGNHLDVSKFESMLTSFVTYHHILQAFNDGGDHMDRRSVEIPSIEPTSDGWVGFCTITGQQYQDFCVLVQDPGLGLEERFVNFDSRMDNMEEIYERINRYTKRHTTQEIVEKAVLLRIPVAPIGNGQAIFDEEHFLSRGVFVDNPDGFKQPRTPFILSKSPARKFERAPELGQDSDRILGDEKYIKSRTQSSDRTKSKLSPDSPFPQPLKGVRVCDLTAFWAGPLATSFMAVLGADVIKVESHKRPDGMRFASGLKKEMLWEWSPVFHGANCAKRAITLDFASETGIALLKELIKKSDLVVENFSPRVMENWGLDWSNVQKINPNAIMLRLPAFGLDGPWRDRTGFAMTIEQASGLAFVTGDPDGRPMVPRGVCDPLGAMHAVFAFLLAHKHRQETGEAQLVEVPLVEAGINAASEQIVEWSAYGHLIERMGNASPHIAPQGIYRCAGEDKWVVISLDRDELWPELAQLIKFEGSVNGDLSSHKQRHVALPEINSQISAWTQTKTMDEAVEILSKAGICTAPVILGYESLDHPQLLARNFHQHMQHPVAGSVPYTSFPISFNGQHLPLQTPAPTLGEHNEEVLSEVLGLSSEEIQELAAKSIIGTEPDWGA